MDNNSNIFTDKTKHCAESHQFRNEIQAYNKGTYKPKNSHKLDTVRWSPIYRMQVGKKPRRYHFIPAHTVQWTASCCLSYHGCCRTYYQVIKTRNHFPPTVRTISKNAASGFLN
ncbi:hypothetical protein Desgi_3883 [Desulfoscipio gibsoniae DSM 7213]|uniref:Uncharacterized protein n=1 Tax=Desulfoscipio gibsoniae DSM 7213 TaxID=767817 RepID=R4KKJ9_9FIRM|nr:hypothetical protein Desgi_3883 [Desulfoscipio gibsoniae DSM 7213]